MFEEPECRLVASELLCVDMLNGSEKDDLDSILQVGESRRGLLQFPMELLGLWLLCVMMLRRYFLNVIFNILNKKVYNYFPYP